MANNAKKLSKAIDACVEAGDWDVLYKEISDIIIADAHSGICESKQDRKTLVRFVDMYGVTEQRQEIRNAFK